MHLIFLPLAHQVTEMKDAKTVKACWYIHNTEMHLPLRTYVHVHVMLEREEYNKYVRVPFFYMSLLINKLFSL